MHKRKPSGGALVANGQAVPTTAPPTPAKQQQRPKHGDARHAAGGSPSCAGATLSMVAIGAFYVLAVGAPYLSPSTGTVSAVLLNWFAYR